MEALLQFITSRNDGCRVKIECLDDKQTVNVNVINKHGEIVDWLQWTGSPTWEFAKWIVSRQDY